MAWGRRISLIGHVVLDGLGGGRERAEAEAEAEAEERRLVCDMGWNAFGGRSRCDGRDIIIYLARGVRRMLSENAGREEEGLKEESAGFLNTMMMMMMMCVV